MFNKWRRKCLYIKAHATGKKLSMSELSFKKE